MTINNFDIKMTRIFQQLLRILLLLKIYILTKVSLSGLWIRFRNVNNKKKQLLD